MFEMMDLKLSDAGDTMIERELEFPKLQKKGLSRRQLKDWCILKQKVSLVQRDSDNLFLCSTSSISTRLPGLVTIDLSIVRIGRINCCRNEMMEIYTEKHSSAAGFMKMKQTELHSRRRQGRLLERHFYEINSNWCTPHICQRVTAE